MVCKKLVHHLMMSAKDAHYVGGLVNGARIVDQWGDVGTELMVYVDGDISLFLGYEKIEFPAPVYVGDFMEYHGWIEKVGNQSYTCKFEAWKVATQLDRTDADLSGVATPTTAATPCAPPYCAAEQQAACTSQSRIRETLRNPPSRIESTSGNNYYKEKYD